MGYNIIASKIRSETSLLENSIGSINGLSFDSVWSGEAHNTLISNLNSCVNSISSQKNLINKYADILDELQKYKDNKEKISSLNTSLSNLSNDEANNSRRNEIRSSISSLDKTNNAIRATINSFISSLTSYSTSFSKIDYDVSNELGYMEYIVDLGELYSLFANKKLDKISDSKNLYNYYSQEEAHRIIDSINAQYSGREAAVNCALGIINMAASVGKKLDYELLRGSNSLLSLDQVVSGADCVSFASWAISQGSDKVTKTFSTKEFVNLGNKINYEQAQQGDVFTLKYSSPGGHVMLVVENHPETQSALVAEAKQEGIVLTEIKYSILKDKKYSARDLTDFYN